MRSTVVFAALLLLASAAVGAAQAQSVSKCVETLAKQTPYIEESTVDVITRVRGPGIECRKMRGSSTGCVRAVEGFALAGAPEVRRISCIADRCSADPVMLEERDGKTVAACVTVRAWSASCCGCGGGRAHFQLSAQVERAIQIDEMWQLIKQCESQ